MKKNLCLVTTTRADWGLLRPLAHQLCANQFFQPFIVATGSHLSNEFGNTYREIEKNGFTIDEKIEILLSSDSNEAMSQSMALALQGFSFYFSHHNIDLLIVLGDRFEILGICAAAINAKIPIAHLCGGEITEGAIDDRIRHAVTKMSTFHFTTCETYKKRVIQMGENPSNVINAGSLSIDNIVKLNLLSRAELAASLDWPALNYQPYAVVTFHPVTLENSTQEEQVNQLLESIASFPNMNFLITKANADAGGRMINDILQNFCNISPNMKLFDSLGNLRYLSAIKHAVMVIGNSSSGLVEVPFLGIPTINIGNRQKGRMRSKSIIDCEPKAIDIITSIKKANSPKFQTLAKNQKHIYGNGHAAETIDSTLTNFMLNTIPLEKLFYHIDF